MLVEGPVLEQAKFCPPLRVVVGRLGWYLHVSVFLCTVVFCREECQIHTQNLYTLMYQWGIKQILTSGFFRAPTISPTPSHLLQESYLLDRWLSHLAVTSVISSRYSCVKSNDFAGAPETLPPEMMMQQAFPVNLWLGMTAVSYTHLTLPTKA